MRCVPGNPIVVVCVLAVAAWQQLVGSGISSFCLPVSSSSEAGESSSSQNDFDHEICVVTMTSASDHETRRCQRKTCRVDEYETHDIVHRFAAGIPSDVTDEDPNNHKQGSVGTAKEVAAAKVLLQEHELFGDILMTPHRDHYKDLSEKRLAILKFGVEHKCRYTFKVDDEFCMNATVARELIAAHEQGNPTEELYIGNGLFQGTEYPMQMTGPNGEVAAPYMSGWIGGVSSKLASYIVGEDWVHSVLRHAYGTSSEDLNLGLWIDYAKSKHNVSVNFVAQSTLVYERRECKD